MPERINRGNNPRNQNAPRAETRLAHQPESAAHAPDHETAHGTGEMHAEPMQTPGLHPDNSHDHARRQGGTADHPTAPVHGHEGHAETPAGTQHTPGDHGEHTAAPRAERSPRARRPRNERRNAPATQAHTPNAHAGESTPVAAGGTSGGLMYKSLKFIGMTALVGAGAIGTLAAASLVASGGSLASVGLGLGTAFQAGFMSVATPVALFAGSAFATIAATFAFGMVGIGALLLLRYGMKNFVDGVKDVVSGIFGGGKKGGGHGHEDHGHKKGGGGAAHH